MEFELDRRAGLRMTGQRYQEKMTFEELIQLIERTQRD